MKTTLILALTLTIQSPNFAFAQANDQGGCTGFNCQPQPPAPRPNNPGCTGFNCEPQYPNPANGGECYPNSCAPGGVPIGNQIPQPEAQETPIYVSYSNGVFRVPLTNYSFIYSRRYLEKNNIYLSPDQVAQLVVTCLEDNLVERNDNPKFRIFEGRKKQLVAFHQCLLF